MLVQFSKESLKIFGLPLHNCISWLSLWWSSLEKRREFLSLVQCYKIVFGIDRIPFLDFFEITKCHLTRANHDYNFYVKVAILNCYKYSFFVWIVNAWNNLPKDVVHSGSLTLFHNRLRIYVNINWYDCK